VLRTELGRTPRDFAIGGNNLHAQAIDEGVNLVPVASGQRSDKRLAVSTCGHRQQRAAAFAQRFYCALMVSVTGFEEPDHDTRV
jgi:hypothetical protein